jgi:hypothetical protein
LQYARASNNSQFLAQVTEPKVLCTLARGSPKRGNGLSAVNW